MRFFDLPCHAHACFQFCELYLLCRLLVHAIIYIVPLHNNNQANCMLITIIMFVTSGSQKSVYLHVCKLNYTESIIILQTTLATCESASTRLYGKHTDHGASCTCVWLVVSEMFIPSGAPWPTVLTACMASVYRSQSTEPWNSRTKMALFVNCTTKTYTFWHIPVCLLCILSELTIMVTEIGIHASGPAVLIF